MCNDILISLRPEHSDSVMSGRKTVEVRRRPVRVVSGTRVWIYTKLPRARIDGYATVSGTYEGTPEELWTRFKHDVAISRPEFDRYLQGAESCFAVMFKSVVPLRTSIPLEEVRQHIKGFRPPQFFKKLMPGSRELALLHKLSDVSR